jgi:uncharacterized membrane protein
MSDQTVIVQGHNPAEGSTANTIYILYLASLLAGVTSLIGVVMAYVYQDAAPAWVRSHYRYQIRTFWIGLLYGLIGGVSVFIVIGAFILLFTVIWFIVRSVKGMQRVSAGQPMENETTWLW